jgi:hypothetical protein
MAVPPSPNFRVEFGGEVDAKGVVGFRLRRREKDGLGGVLRRFMGVQYLPVPLFRGLSRD